MRRALAALAVLLLLGTGPQDSQFVLQRYELELGDLKAPPAMIFSYTVSQEGATTIEQRHRVYRSGLRVRDETLTDNGETLKPKVVQITRREDRYAIARLAPRSASYTFLFLRPVRNGASLDYEYEATPNRAESAFSVTRVVIDGTNYLPRTISVHTAGASASGDGQLEYGRSGGYWVPVAAMVQATVNGKPARERITWGEYRFPPSLPPSTFIAPKPLPTATLPPI